MKINKSIWIFALILVLSSASVFAFELSDIYRNFYFILIVNALIIWSILFMAQTLIPNPDAKVKLVLWIATFGLTALIVWNFTPRGAAYFWEVGIIAQYLKLWLIVNTAIFSIGLYTLVGFLEIRLETTPGKIGIILVTILLGALMANNLGNKPLWDTKNFVKIKDYLLAGEHEETMPDGTKAKVGGILTLDKDEVFESRLFIFLLSTILFAWFLNSYMGLTNQPKMTFIMAFIIGANLASKGATSGTIIGLGEAFAILIVGQQVAHGIAGPRPLAYILSIILVEWIFCAVFQQSRVLAVLGGVVQGILQSGLVTTILIVYITIIGLRSGNIYLAGLVAAGGVLAGLFSYFTGLIGKGIAAAIDINVCAILSQHKIFASASSGTGKVASLIGGGAVSYAGFIPPDAAPWIGAISFIIAIVGPFILWNSLKNRV